MLRRRQPFATHGASHRCEDRRERERGLLSLFRRGTKGAYQRRHEKHLRRYVADLSFHFNNRVGPGVGGEARAEKALGGIVGKRLL
jgi:hypothetical protein